MAKKEKKARTDTVKTGIFKKVVRIPIDAEATKKRKLQMADMEMKIDEMNETLRPTKEKVTALRAEKRKLKMDIKSGTVEQETKIYEVKNFKSGEAIAYLAKGNTEVGRRTLGKDDYQADVEDKPLKGGIVGGKAGKALRLKNPVLTPGEAVAAARKTKAPRTAADPRFQAALEASDAQDGPEAES
jgi:hypothetical protein